MSVFLRIVPKLNNFQSNLIIRNLQYHVKVCLTVNAHSVDSDQTVQCSVFENCSKT